MKKTGNRIATWAIIIGLLLCIPLVAMQYTTEVGWDLFDFVFMGTLLFGAALVYELVARKMNSSSHRIAVGIAIVMGVLFIWVNAAAGIIGE